MREHYIPTTNVIKSRFLFMNVQHVAEYMPMASRAMDYYKKKWSEQDNWIHERYMDACNVHEAICEMTANINNYVVR